MCCMKQNVMFCNNDVSIHCKAKVYKHRQRAHVFAIGSSDLPAPLELPPLEKEMGRWVTLTHDRVEREV